MTYKVQKERHGSFSKLDLSGKYRWVGPKFLEILKICLQFLQRFYANARKSHNRGIPLTLEKI